VAGRGWVFIAAAGVKARLAGGAILSLAAIVCGGLIFRPPLVLLSCFFFYYRDPDLVDFCGWLTDRSFALVDHSHRLTISHLSSFSEFEIAFLRRQN